jgi:S-formylglutathione hydrolase FrmB
MQHIRSTALAPALAATLLTCAQPALAQLRGTVQPITIQGPVTGRPVVFSLYLPEGYNSSSPDLPTIYHLHGINGTHSGGQISSVPLSYESARAAGLIGAAIIVFPDGYGDSFWANSANSDKPAEINVLDEIIPYIDATYRSKATRESRVIEGFSMGGFGAMKFACKRPDLFSIVVAYDGALLQWPEVQSRHAVQAAEIFDNSGASFDQYSPWYWSQQNAGTLRTDVAFRMVVGAIVQNNRVFRDQLLALSIPVDYVETGLSHSLGPILDAQGAASWAFIGEHLSDDGGGTDCAADFNGAGGVSVQDIFDFLASWQMRRPAADVNGIDDITVQDIFDFLTAWNAGCP